MEHFQHRGGSEKLPERRVDKVHNTRDATGYLIVRRVLQHDPIHDFGLGGANPSALGLRSACAMWLTFGVTKTANFPIFGFAGHRVAAYQPLSKTTRAAIAVRPLLQ